MKTLLFTLEYPPFKGGVANVYENIIKYWPEKSEISVLNNNNNEIVKKYLPFFKWIPGFFKLNSVCNKNKIDHIIVGHLLPLGLISYIISKIRKNNYSIILHGMDFAFSQKNWRKRCVAKLVLMNSSNIICMNSYVSNLLIKKLGVKIKHKIKVVNPGIDSEIVNSNKQNKKLINKYNLNNKKIVFSVSRLVKRKGVDMLIKSIESALEKVPNLEYYIAGTGPDEQYLKDIKKDLPKKVQDKITFLGKISDEEKWAWFSVCDLFAMPSRQVGGDFEGFGIVYLEANLYGKPVIAGNSGGIGDAVVNNYNGYLVDPMDTRDVSHHIVKLLINPDLSKEIGSNGRKRVLDNFKWIDKVGIIHKAIIK